MWPIFWPNNGGKTSNNKAQKKGTLFLERCLFIIFEIETQNQMKISTTKIINFTPTPLKKNSNRSSVARLF
jgi:hypothetical protein